MATLASADIVLTPSAAARVATIAERQNKPAILRLAVDGGGCSGFQYKFELADAPDADDLVVHAGPARVLVDPVSLDLLAGSQLDWAEALIGAHFAIRNPQAVASCGCGTSGGSGGASSCGTL